MKYVLGIDFGGGASKATLLSQTGKVAAVSACEYPTGHPQTGYAEQNPHDWYEAARKNISAVISESGIAAGDIEMIAVDAATHTAVLTDENFNVLMPSIYWTDIRSVAEVGHLTEKYGELIMSQVCHKPDTIWTLPQLMWIKTHCPGVWTRTRKIMFAKDYVRYMLTGGYETDSIEAEGSMLYDYRGRCWSPELCGILGIKTDMLPPVVSPFTVTGGITARAAEDTGLVVGTPVCCGSTDTAMEVFAAGAVRAGQMTLKLATAGRICVITDRVYPDPQLINYSHIIDGLWYPGSATKSCAASLRWFRDCFGGDYAGLDRQAEGVAPGSDGLIFSPYLNGELTPYSDPLLRGSFIGIRPGHTKAHFTRAVLEGVAYSMLDCFETVNSIGVPHGSEAIIIGGGSKSRLWRRITADVLGISLTENEYSDSSFGSAMTAGIAAGFWSSPSGAVAVCNSPRSVTHPDAELHERYVKYFKVYKRIHDALAPVYHDTEI